MLDSIVIICIVVASFSRIVVTLIVCAAVRNFSCSFCSINLNAELKLGVKN